MIAKGTAQEQKALDLNRTTTHFYEQFQQEHAIFISSIQGISSQSDCKRYGLLMLNRLMVLYFLQKKGFLDGNINYLLDKLRLIQKKCGKDSFLSFYQHLLLRLFHEPVQRQTRVSEELLGVIPHLNTGLLEVHELERDNKDIQIADEAFERIFTFFDSYHWQMNELDTNVALHPDSIGHIFEKYINQKQTGAYYTREDISTYVSKNVIIPHIFKSAEQKYQNAFRASEEMWQLLRIDAERYISEAVRTKEYLPTETEREYRERRIRYETMRDMLVTGKIHCINQFVSYNLDSERFTQDVIEECSDSELLRAFYESIEAITIVDPTCGSGAFLFAALHILEPLYAACLDSMSRMVINKDSEKRLRVTDLELFRNVLHQEKSHSDRSYFILKTIILNSLYGVDIMKEAVEVCKLRLFLRLVTQLKSREEIRRLSDMDFNIRSGNTLVGFARYDETREAIAGGIQSRIEVDKIMEGIKQESRQMGQEIAYFRRLQMQLEGAQEGTEKRKSSLHNRQKQLRTKLNRYLASQYGKSLRNIPATDTYERAFKRWCSSHQPFHWFIDFHNVMEQGGFDVIIGNPPYVEYSKVKAEYEVRQTESCGNLYAAVIKRSLILCRDEQSYLGLIVPLSVCGGERFDQLRRTITKQTAKLWLANFEIFPCRLFDGAFQRLSILLAQYGTEQKCDISVTRIQRWYAAERTHLINMIAYTPTRQAVKADVFPKLTSPVQEIILQKIVECSRGAGRKAAIKVGVGSELDTGQAWPLLLGEVLHPCKTEYFVYYQEATNYWMKATCCVPYYKKDGVVMEPTHGRFLYFGDQQTAYTMMALMNSSLFYVWFATFSDGFHLSHALVKEFPVGKYVYKIKELAILAKRLEEDIKAHARMSTRNTKATATKEGHLIELEEYRMGYSKGLLDEIDRVLARYYGFSEEELDFIVKYDGKYRMGRESRVDEED